MQRNPSSTFAVTLFIAFACILASPLDAAERDLGVAPLSPSGGEVRGKNWLFVIGIDEYQDWPQLKTAVRDGG